MLSAVLDTNILASGVLTSSTIPRQIIGLWRKGFFKLFISKFIIDELKETLNKPYFKRLIKKYDVEKFFELLETDAILVRLTERIEGTATHPEDDFIIATAINARADYLVTGDIQLQNLKQFEGIKIVSPRIFSEIIEDEKTT